MVNQPCMMTPGAPAVSRLSLAADGSAVTVSFALRAWTLVEAATQRTNTAWKRHVTHGDGCVSIRIPIVRSGTLEWFDTVCALQALQLMVYALQQQELEALTDEPNIQLAWIDALHVTPGESDLCIVASPRFAGFIQFAPDDVFVRVTERMIHAERVIRGTDDVPKTRRVSRYVGVLHLSVGEDCACLGVGSADLPRAVDEGWEAYGHNLRFPYRILLVLVALAALEDGYRRVK